MKSPDAVLAQFERRLVAWNARVRAPNIDRALLARDLKVIEALLPADVHGRRGVKLWDAFSNYVAAVSSWLDGREAAGANDAEWLPVLEEGVDDAWEDCEKALADPLVKR